MSKRTVECCKHLHSKQTVNIIKIKLIIVVHSKNFKGGRPCINLLILIVIIISTFYSHRLFSLIRPYIFPLSLYLSLLVYLIICVPVPTRVEFSLLSSSSSSIISFYSLLQLRLSLPLPCSPSCFSQSPLSVLYILYFLIFLFNPILPLVLFVRFPFSSFLELNLFSQLKGHLSCNVFLRLPTNFSSRREGWFSYR